MSHSIFLCSWSGRRRRAHTPLADVWNDDSSTTRSCSLTLFKLITYESFRFVFFSSSANAKAAFYLLSTLSHTLHISLFTPRRCECKFYDCFKDSKFIVPVLKKKAAAAKSRTHKCALSLAHSQWDSCELRLCVEYVMIGKWLYVAFSSASYFYFTHFVPIEKMKFQTFYYLTEAAELKSTDSTVHTQWIELGNEMILCKELHIAYSHSYSN